jgi:3-isopropylmalate/(R)-2-methylmalate dehydratase small subunit
VSLKGKVHIFGDNIDTDGIIPARYLITTDPKELAEHCMEGVEADWPKKIKPGDILVAGDNFGCGSSREHAPWAIKGAGVACVIAKGFARIFFRNSINIGLPILEIAETDRIKPGDELEVDLKAGVVKNLTRNETYKSQPFPEFLQEIIQAEGLMKYVKKQLHAAGVSAKPAVPNGTDMKDD